MSKAGGIARSPTTLLPYWVLGANHTPGVTDPTIMEALSLRDGVIFANL